MLANRVGAIALALAATASPAGATVVLTTYTGVVTEAVGDAEPQFFGAPDASLEGKRYSATFRADFDSTPNLFRQLDANVAEIIGGAESGTPSPVLASLTIDGVTVAFAPGWFGDAFKYNNTPDGDGTSDTAWTTFRDDVLPDGAQREEFFLTVFQVATTSGDLFADDYFAANYKVQPGDLAEGTMTYTLRLTGDLFEEDHASHFKFSVDRVRVRTADSASAAPEPAAWALMIAGFGIVGGLARYRRASLGDRSMSEGDRPT